MEIVEFLKICSQIQSNCKEFSDYEDFLNLEYMREEERVDSYSKNLMKQIEDNRTDYVTRYFENLREKIKSIINVLLIDYSEEWNGTTIDVHSIAGATFEEYEVNLSDCIDKINININKLNDVDFDNLVSPVEITFKKENDEFFYESSKSGISEKYTYETSLHAQISYPKPLKVTVQELFYHCKKAIYISERMEEIFKTRHRFDDFANHISNISHAWLNEKEALRKKKFSERFNSLFVDANEKAVSEDVFLSMYNESKKADVDLVYGTNNFKTKINIGDYILPITKDKRYLSYIDDSPILNKYIKEGKLIAPLILDLKECGNIFLNISEDYYETDTVEFINQIIIQFLLSFPAKRINFCLIDLDNKMNFSQFKSLTKIQSNILFDGIIRDDRQLENTVKDMEQTMYKIQDDILSYNNVKDIYEYNERFAANPQNVHLFVLVNYPTGIRDDLSKRILKIMQDGNRAGIFTFLINNKSCPVSPGYKLAEYQQFIDYAQKISLVINKRNDGFSLESSGVFSIQPKGNITVAKLPSIIEMLKNNAEISNQQVVPISLMFENTDEMVASKRSIPSSAEVLDIPIGARGGEVQNILLKTTGDGSAHAVIIGGTGSGKSNLLHTIIMSACYKYSPEELNLYLVDFKGGVEFKFYEANKVREHQIPHIKLTGLTSDLEDGVAILSNLHKELRKREDEFRRCGVEDIVQYRNLGKMIPRLFVIIDEIQELFEQDDKLGQKAIDILRELFKKGRAFGINILWASQNIPNAPGLKDKVLSQIGNRISLRLNEPDDALAIKIDPKVVRNLNRPEKGLGVINDIRYGNESIEFRVAYAETSENRQEYAREIINKWRDVTESTNQEPLFIVGDEDEPSPIMGNTIYDSVPVASNIVSKSFDSYRLQIGQDYVTGKPYNIEIALRESKMNLLFVGYDIEILRDMMGYSLLSIVMEQITNADCVAEDIKIYYANGEMVNPKNSDDLFNVIRVDFENLIENVSSTEKMISCIKSLYRTYKERRIESDSLEYAKTYTPRFVVIHSMQRYIDLFNENPIINLTEASTSENTPAVTVVQTNSLAGNAKTVTADDFSSLFKGANSPKPTSVQKGKMPDTVFFSDAVKELLDQGGKFGVHFIISIDNPLSINTIKNCVSEMMYKVFIKGVNVNVVSQLLGDYKIANSLSNPKVALIATQDERIKIRVYRYDSATDAGWYKKLCAQYKNLRRL